VIRGTHDVIEPLDLRPGCALDNRIVQLAAKITF